MDIVSFNEPSLLVKSRKLQNFNLFKIIMKIKNLPYFQYNNTKLLYIFFHYIIY